jgi:hypothetical protein
MSNKLQQNIVIGPALLIPQTNALRVSYKQEMMVKTGMLRKAKMELKDGLLSPNIGALKNLIIMGMKNPISHGKNL